ncbi:hypothetical protein B0H17DRAFT_1034668, partial [Mycena rosella]
MDKTSRHLGNTSSKHFKLSISHTQAGRLTLSKITQGIQVFDSTEALTPISHVLPPPSIIVSIRRGSLVFLFRSMLH